MDAQRTTVAVQQYLCAHRPDLIPELRQRLERCRVLDREVMALLPSGSDGPTPDIDLRVRSARATLPSIPGYELSAVLGHGGAGVVYRARHLALNREVALKMLLSGVHAAREERARFKRERRRSPA